ncbi:MAG: phospholipase A [Ramlibacter sp.]
MATRKRHHRTQLRAAQAARLAVSTLAAGLLAAAPAGAQTPAAAQAGWQACTATADSSARLACFDQWARQQQGPAASSASASSLPTSATPAPVQSLLPATRVISITTDEGCHDPQYSALSRFWELEAGSDCGTFGIRGYRPISLSLVGADGVNNRPVSENPTNVATATQAYNTTETRIQLSVRTKIAQSLLTQGHPTLKDSLWFGYTQQSYWQLFSGGISRPFRSTDHEPELVYVYPTDVRLPAGWRLRYSGVGLVHQSNGQSLPLSRSWNRVYLMAGMELGNQLQLTGRLWKRLPENKANDDNPGISDYIGRAELGAQWNVNRDNTLGATVRHSLRGQGHGSVRLEWLRTLASAPGGGPLSGLRLHTQLFNGYGDSLLDYNRRRTVFSVGMSLVDW